MYLGIAQGGHGAVAFVQAKVEAGEYLRALDSLAQRNRMPNLASSDVRVDDRVSRTRQRRATLVFAFTVLLTADRGGSAQTLLPTWMAGCWERQTPTTIITEQWSRPRAGMMLGSGQTTRGDSTIEFEHTRVFRRGRALVYAAQPSGQAPTEFVADTPSDTLIVFENTAHDFPQRVIYRQRKDGQLQGRIEGKKGDKEMGFDFPMKRTGCE